MNGAPTNGYPDHTTPSPPDDGFGDSPEFLKTLGERVRKARTQNGLSRQVLADRSGVSLRYLAQLEAGKGNISVALLAKVASAVGRDIEWMVAKEDPWKSDLADARQLLGKASAAQQRYVLDFLKKDSPVTSKSRRIALIGLRGAGKSTLGKLAAERLNLPFRELNTEIEAASGMPVNEVFSLYGQEGYRRLEHEALERIVENHDELVLAVAGGIVSEPDTYDYFLNHFSAIWLRASPEEHMSRVQEQGDKRPMSGNPDALAHLTKILASREALYSRADVKLDTSGRNQDQSLSELVALIQDEFAIHS